MITPTAGDRDRPRGVDPLIVIPPGGSATPWATPPRAHSAAPSSAGRSRVRRTTAKRPGKRVAAVEVVSEELLSDGELTAARDVYDTGFVWISRTLESIFRLAGEKELAERVRTIAADAYQLRDGKSNA